MKQMCAWRFLFLYLGMVVVTALLVFSGFDWMYFVFVMRTVPKNILFIADGFGFVMPLLLLLGLYGIYFWTKNALYKLYVYAVLHTILLSILLSETIKIFTGRTSPPHHFNGRDFVFADNSHDFHFGFMREQIIGGWPSSHATIAFALAVVLTYILPPRWYIRLSLFAMACFIGIGVTFGFHWLSEFVAGAFLGTAVGMLVGKYYSTKLQMYRRDRG